MKNFWCPITWGLFSFRFTWYKMYILPNWKALQTILKTLVLSLWSFLPLKPLVFPLFLPTKSGKQNINFNFSTHNIHFQSYLFDMLLCGISGKLGQAMVHVLARHTHSPVRILMAWLINKICRNQVFPQLQLTKWPQYPNHIGWWLDITGYQVVHTASDWLIAWLVRVNGRGQERVSKL